MSQSRAPCFKYVLFFPGLGLRNEGQKAYEDLFTDE